MIWDLPSGKRTVCYWKWAMEKVDVPFWKMLIFQFATLVCQGRYIPKWRRSWTTFSRFFLRKMTKNSIAWQPWELPHPFETQWPPLQIQGAAWKCHSRNTSLQSTSTKAGRGCLWPGDHWRTPLPCSPWPVGGLGPCLLHQVIGSCV